MRRATSPGSTWAARKITTLRSRSVMRPSPKRLARKRAMAGPSPRRATRGRSGLQARLVDVDMAHGRHLHPGHAGLRPREVEVEVGEDDRHLVEQQLLDLLRRRALGLQVERGHVLVDELVVRVVLEVGGVPRAVALE